MRNLITLGLLAPTLTLMSTAVFAEDTAPAVKDSYSMQELLELATNREKEIKKTVRDYSCTIYKRERINGILQEPRFIRAKVRAAGVHNGQQRPLSVHLSFVKPEEVAGRELIFVEGENNGQMMVKRGGKRFSNVTAKVDPDSDLAHTETLMSITHLGFDGMVSEIVAQIRQDIAADPSGSNSQVKVSREAKINNRKCTAVVVVHPQRADGLTFHRAEFFVDNEVHLPLRVAAYDWPQDDGAKPELLAEFTYTNVKINVGLTDADFDLDQLRTASR